MSFDLLTHYYDTDGLLLSSSDRERVYRPPLLLEPLWNPRPRLLTLLFLLPSLLYCSLLLLLPPPLDEGGTFSLSMRSLLKSPMRSSWDDDFWRPEKGELRFAL